MLTSESVSVSVRGSKAFKEQSCKFGTIVLALAALEQNRPPSDPIKPAMWLADKLGCTERGAQYLIDGERGVSAKAIAFVVNELLN